MTDQRLRDLLHDSVSDVSMPDTIDAAWSSGLRSRRRRRTAGLAAGATALVVGVAGAVALVDRGPSEPGVSTGPSSHGPSTPPTPSTSGPATTVRPYVPDPAPDAHYAGRPVWWSPRLAQEELLPAYPDSPLPSTIIVNEGVTPLVDHPIRRAVAAFAGSTEGISLQFVVVLAPDGRQLAVSTTPVQPMTDPEGHQRVRVGPSLLSRSGQYLMFPQDHSILIYTLQTGQWRTIHTGHARTWDATWIGNTRIALEDPARPMAVVPQYSIDGADEGSANMGAIGLPFLHAGQTYGRARSGRFGTAQAFYPGLPIPQPPALGLSPGQSDWINVNGPPSAILEIPAEPGRQKACCQVDGWIGPHTVMYDSSSSTGTRLLAWDVGTGRFYQVSRLAGAAVGTGTVVASYAQFPAARLPMPY